MDRSSTVARFIERFREAAPLSPHQRRRDREAMEGQFWWAQSTNSEDGDFDRSTNRSGCGASSPPLTQDGDGSNRDLEEDSGSRGRAPPPPPYGYREQTSFISTKHKTAVEAAPQDARVEAKGGCHHPNTHQDQPTLASSSLVLSPRSPGPPGPPSDDGNGMHQQTLALAGEAEDEGDELHHQQTLALAGETEVAELAASLLAASLPEEHQTTAASDFGASSSRLPEERSVGAMNASIEGEGCDELANLDARAGSLLEHCRRLLSRPPIDDADQEATHPLPDPFAFGERTSGAGASRVDATSSHTHEGHTRQGLEQRAWMLLDNREPLEHWEANLHGGSLLPTGADSDLNLSPMHSSRNHQAARAAVPIEDLEGLALAKIAKVDATHDSTVTKKTISGLGGGESRAWSSEQGKKEARGDEGGGSLSLLLRNEFPMNRAAPPCMVGESDEAFTYGRSTDRTQKRYGREMALPDLTSATGDLLTGMDSVGNRPQEDVSAMTPSARRGRQDDSSVASLKYFAEDPVIVALVERAHEIQAEIERRRLFGVEDGKRSL